MVGIVIGMTDTADILRVACTEPGCAVGNRIEGRNAPARLEVIDMLGVGADTLTETAIVLRLDRAPGCADGIIVMAGVAIAGSISDAVHMLLTSSTTSATLMPMTIGAGISDDSGL